MDRAGGQLLARAAFPFDKDRRVRARDRVDPSQDGADPLGHADDATLCLRLGQLAAKGLVLAGKVLVLQQLGQFQQEFLGREGLLDVIERAEFHRLDGRGHRPVGGHHDRRLVGESLLHVPQKRQPVLAGHAQIRQDNVEGGFRQFRFGLEGVGGGHNRVTGGPDI